VVCLPVFEVQPDGILDVAQSLIVGVSLAVTALERRAGDIEALRIAFDDNRQRVVLHADIVPREARLLNCIGGSVGHFPKSARSGAPPVISANVKRQARVILPR
jgi:flagellar biosynthesis/type III secretory pathway ATPase